MANEGENGQTCDVVEDEDVQLVIIETPPPSFFELRYWFTPTPQEAVTFSQPETKTDVDEPPPEQALSEEVYFPPPETPPPPPPDQVEKKQTEEVVEEAEEEQTLEEAPPPPPPVKTAVVTKKTNPKKRTKRAKTANNEQISHTSDFPYHKILIVLVAVSGVALFLKRPR